MKTLIGAHFSIAHGLHNALYTAQDYNCTALQIFTKNSKTWEERFLSPEEIDSFNKAREETNIKAIASHTSYLINLAAPDSKKHDKSCNALKQELTRCSMLGIPYAVLHPGSHMGEGQEQGISRIAESIISIFDETPQISTRLLLETTAGQGTVTGHTFEQLAAIMDKVGSKERIGICLDTSHIFTAGYDIRTKDAYRQTTEIFNSVIGIGNLYLIHLNDSKKKLGSKLDRHEHIGRGHIGTDAFAYIMNDPELSHIPKIIETPKEKGLTDWDKKNLETLKSLITP